MAEPVLTFDTLIEPIGSDFAARYDLVPATDPSALDRLGDFRVAMTSGGKGLTSEWIEKLPNLELIAVNGVGTDQIDLDLCVRRRIHVATTLGVLTDDVADTAIGLMLGAVRELGRGERHVRSGEWAGNGKLGLSRSVAGKKLGIIGLGAIGKAIGERAQAFKMDVGFWNRSQKSVPGWEQFAEPVDLARWADVLVVAVAATGDTKALVSRDVIAALGADGFVVNIARGSVIDEAALLDALESGQIAGAGLDVFLNEPKIDARFLALDTVFLAPHVGSATIETRTAMSQLVSDNVDAFFEGKGPLTSVTGERFA